MRTPHTVSVLHAMAWARTSRQAVFYGTWALQRRLTSLELLQGEAATKPMSSTMKAARVIVRMLDDGVHSMHEFDFLKECRRRGLPEPRRQRARKDSTGRTRYTDFEFEINGRALVVEIDGVGHLDADVHIDDQWRANELAMQDAKVLRIPGLALRVDPEPFFMQLERALDAMRRAGR